MVSTDVKEMLSKHGVKVNEKTKVTTSLLSDFVFTEDNIINNFLLKRGREILEIQGESRIKIGEIFEDVRNKIGRSKQFEGAYVYWLSAMGTNKMTAMRYRNRYILHEEVKTDAGKSMVSLIGDNIINNIMKQEDRSKIIDRLNNGIKRKDLLDMLRHDNGVISIEDKKTNQEFKRITSKYKKIDTDKLSSDEKDKIHNLLVELESIINSAL